MLLWFDTVGLIGEPPATLPRLNSPAIDILAYLAKETVAMLVDFALLVRQDSCGAVPGGPLRPLTLRPHPNTSVASGVSNFLLPSFVCHETQYSSLKPSIFSWRSCLSLLQKLEKLYADIGLLFLPHQQGWFEQDPAWPINYLHVDTVLYCIFISCRSSLQNFILSHLYHMFMISLA